MNFNRVFPKRQMEHLTGLCVGSWSARSPVCPLNWLAKFRASSLREDRLCVCPWEFGRRSRRMGGDPYRVKGLGSSVGIAREGPLLSKLL